ncbi:UMP kinase [Candidatus Uhrbacteria bacterium]|nr:UMP kinase [Candidatus Uhrbacteria bacterium]
MPSNQPAIVLSLGGSLIVPKEGIDTAFLKKFRALILRHAAKGRRFVIICGGGTTARDYQKAAGKVTPLTRDDLDWIGIHATRLNAHLLRTIFRGNAHPRIITDPHEEMPTLKPIVIGAGWRPGCSTDFDAVLLARQYGAATLVNLSNIAYVYDKDPRVNADAAPITALSWKEFRKRFGGRWDPGLNSPFDPVAAREAQKLKMRVVIADGRDFKNLDRILAGKDCKGTVIS